MHFHLPHVTTKIQGSNVNDNNILFECKTTYHLLGLDSEFMHIHVRSNASLSILHRIKVCQVPQAAIIGPPLRCIATETDKVGKHPTFCNTLIYLLDPLSFDSWRYGKGSIWIHCN